MEATEKKSPASIELHEKFREIPTGNWNDQKSSITGFTAPGNRYFGSRALVAQVEVSPNNWNDQKTKVTGYTAPSNKYFATRQRLAYHPEDKKFGTWINDVVTSDSVTVSPPEPQVNVENASNEKSKKERLLEYEKEYLERLEKEGKLKPEQKKISEEVIREMSDQKVEKPEAKVEEKPEAKVEEKPEAKVEEKPEAKGPHAHDDKPKTTKKSKPKKPKKQRDENFWRTDGAKDEYVEEYNVMAKDGKRGASLLGPLPKGFVPDAKAGNTGH